MNAYFGEAVLCMRHRPQPSKDAGCGVAYIDLMITFGRCRDANWVIGACRFFLDIKRCEELAELKSTELDDIVVA